MTRVPSLIRGTDEQGVGLKPPRGPRGSRAFLFLCAMCPLPAATAVGAFPRPPASLGQELVFSSEPNLVSNMSPDLWSF